MLRSFGNQNNRACIVWDFNNVSFQSILIQVVEFEILIDLIAKGMQWNSALIDSGDLQMASIASVDQRQLFRNRKFNFLKDKVICLSEE